MYVNDLLYVVLPCAQLLATPPIPRSRRKAYINLPLNQLTSDEARPHIHYPQVLWAEAVGLHLAMVLHAPDYPGHIGIIAGFGGVIYPTAYHHHHYHLRCR